MDWPCSVRHHCHLEVGWACFGLTPETVNFWAQLSMFKLVMETQINAAWFDSAWPKVLMEKPYKKLTRVIEGGRAKALCGVLGVWW